MLKTMSLRYDPQQDRLLLLLRLALEEGQEQVHALHLTRRLCAAWRLDLQQMVDLSAQTPERLQPAIRAAVSKAHHDARASQANVRTEPHAQDDGADETGPIRLVTRIQCGRKRGADLWLIQFHCENGMVLALQLSGKSLHGLVDALSRRVAAAQWNLAPLPLERNAPDPTLPGPHLH